MNNMLEYKGYFGKVEFSSDDDCFFGKLIGINDLVTFEGCNVEEIKQAFHEAVDDYIFMCERAGREPQRTYKGSFNIRINPELHKRASIIAAAEKISLNQLVESAILEKVLSSSIMRHNTRKVSHSNHRLERLSNSDKNPQLFRQ